MKKVITANRIPIKLWLDDIDEQALLQAQHLANLPFAYDHIAVMPDAHVGYGMPIGAVLAAIDTVIPNAVGVDIGCGVCAVRTSCRGMGHETLKKIVALIRRAIPLGFERHSSPQRSDMMPEVDENNMPVVKVEYRKARHQLGTLGGGNHFIEIQKGDDGFIWLMIHSGSRNLGHTVASHHNRVAERLSSSQKFDIPKSWQLAFLPVHTREGAQYIAEMNYCVEFALANRMLMMQKVQEIMVEVAGVMEFGKVVNRSHNFAARERHGGEEVMVHRKGATRVRRDEPGLVPGSQGSASYIVRGLGNDDSFHSCSHGAGRRLGRKQAIRELDLKKEQSSLEKIGVIHNVYRKKDLEEAPGAYKDITVVMENQMDLVAVEVELCPLAVVKS